MVGMLSSSGYEAVGYFRSRYQPENETHPDIQLVLVTSIFGSALSKDRLRTLRSKLNLNNKVTALDQTCDILTSASKLALFFIVKGLLALGPGLENPRVF